MAAMSGSHEGNGFESYCCFLRGCLAKTVMQSVMSKIMLLVAGTMPQAFVLASPCIGRMLV